MLNFQPRPEYHSSRLQKIPIGKLEIGKVVKHCILNQFGHISGFARIGDQLTIKVLWEDTDEPKVEDTENLILL